MFDHKVAELVAETGMPVILAGGLSADNVHDCMTSTSSFGADASSGVERSKGKKDEEKVERYVREARRAQEAVTGREKKIKEEEMLA